MNLENIKDNNKIFEDIKHNDENGNEYWYARELQVVLDYKSWDKFKHVIDKAKTSCGNSNYIIDDHFSQVGKTIKMPKNAQKLMNDYKLSRYDCYLLIQNSDSKKQVVALWTNLFCNTNKKART